MKLLGVAHTPRHGCERFYSGALRNRDPERNCDPERNRDPETTVTPITTGDASGQRLSAVCECIGG